MEFFEMYNLVYEIESLFSLGDDLETARRLIWERMSISLGVGAGLYLLLLLLGGFGIYTMAKRSGMKYPWMGFIPFANTYYIGKLAGEANFFGQKMKRAGLYAMLAEIAYFAINLITLIADFLLVPYYDTIERVDVFGEVQSYIGPTAESTPSSLQWAFNGFSTYAFTIVSYAALIALTVLSCVVYVALFRKYFARNPILMTFLCALFPVRGIVLFAVRKNNPVDYDMYMRRRMEEMARRSYGYGPGGTGTYGSGTPGSGTPGGGYGSGTPGGYGPGDARPADTPQDPFGDFDDKKDPPPPPSDGSDDPFSDF